MTGRPSVRLLLLMLLASSLNTGSCVEEVQAFIGDSVLLKCIYNEASSLPASYSVYWRDKDDAIVLDIKQNKDDLSTQDKTFRGRVFGEDKFYQNGNFSVQIRDLRQSDGGLYECHIPLVDFQRRVRLVVTDVVLARGTTPPGSSGGSSSVTPISSWFSFLFFSLSYFVV